MRIGNLILWHIELTLGSTSVVASAVQVSNAPIPFTSISPLPMMCPVRMHDISANVVYPGWINIDDANGSFRCFDTTGTYAVQATVGTSIPFTWAATDTISERMVYDRMTITSEDLLSVIGELEVTRRVLERENTTLRRRELKEAKAAAGDEIDTDEAQERLARPEELRPAG